MLLFRRDLCCLFTRTGKLEKGVKWKQYCWPSVHSEAAFVICEPSTNFITQQAVAIDFGFPAVSKRKFTFLVDFCLSAKKNEPIRNRIHRFQTYTGSINIIASFSSSYLWVGGKGVRVCDSVIRLIFCYWVTKHKIASAALFNY